MCQADKYNINFHASNSFQKFSVWRRRGEQGAGHLCHKKEQYTIRFPAKRHTAPLEAVSTSSAHKKGIENFLQYLLYVRQRSLSSFFRERKGVCPYAYRLDIPLVVISPIYGVFRCVGELEPKPLHPQFQIPQDCQVLSDPLPGRGETLLQPVTIGRRKLGLPPFYEPLEQHHSGLAHGSLKWESRS